MQFVFFAQKKWMNDQEMCFITFMGCIKWFSFAEDFRDENLRVVKQFLASVSRLPYFFVNQNLDTKSEEQTKPTSVLSRSHLSHTYTCEEFQRNRLSALELLEFDCCRIEWHQRMKIFDIYCYPNAPIYTRNIIHAMAPRAIILRW